MIKSQELAVLLKTAFSQRSYEHKLQDVPKVFLEWRPVPGEHCAIYNGNIQTGW